MNEEKITRKDYKTLCGIETCLNIQLQNKIDRTLSFIKILHNNLEDYTEYKEYTNIFNEMLKDIEKILEGKNENI